MNSNEGVGPDQLRAKGLLARIEPERPKEVILVHESHFEGAIAIYMARPVRVLRVRLTRIANGRPSEATPSTPTG